MKNALIVLFSVFLLLSCKSEEEKIFDQRLVTLDSTFVAHQDQFQAIFAGLEAMEKTIKPVEVVSDTLGEGLDPEAQAIWTSREAPFGAFWPGPAGKTSTDPPIDTESNLLIATFADSSWSKNQEEKLKTVSGFIPKWLYWYERLESGEWDDVFTDFDSSYPEDYRLERYEFTLELMQKLASMRYLGILQELLFINGQEDGSGFTGGQALARVLLYDLVEKRELPYCYTKAVNSFSVFTMSYDGESNLEKELAIDLRKNLVKNVKEDLDKAFSNAAVRE